MTDLSRRGILGAIICAPAIIRVAKIMPIKPLPRWLSITGGNLTIILPPELQLIHDQLLGDISIAFRIPLSKLTGTATDEIAWQSAGRILETQKEFEALFYQVPPVVSGGLEELFQKMSQ